MSVSRWAFTSSQLHKVLGLLYLERGAREWIRPESSRTRGSRLILPPTLGPRAGAFWGTKRQTHSLSEQENQRWEIRFAYRAASGRIDGDCPIDTATASTALPTAGMKRETKRLTAGTASRAADVSTPYARDQVPPQDAERSWNRGDSFAELGATKRSFLRAGNGGTERRGAGGKGSVIAVTLALFVLRRPKSWLGRHRVRG
ncbi:hypothetical protein C8R47DRAFT_1081229 [Mycena vitilis]|nr:hypothetical protein C8R47DRAFT_1081229 [Mycena vitilis]